VIFFWFLFFSFWNHSRNGTRSTLLRSRPRKTKTYACATLCLFSPQVLCHCPRFRVKFFNFCTCLRLFLSLSLSPWMNRLTCVQKHMPRLSRRPHFPHSFLFKLKMFSVPPCPSIRCTSHTLAVRRNGGESLTHFLLVIIIFFSIRKISWHSRNDPTLSLVLYKNKFFPNNITQSLILELR
jgi:hypothetical protein